MAEQVQKLDVNSENLSKDLGDIFSVEHQANVNTIAVAEKITRREKVKRYTQDENILKQR